VLLPIRRLHDRRDRGAAQARDKKAVQGKFSDGFSVESPMNYQAFTNGSLTLMYEAVRGALAADDAREHRGEKTQFRVRDTPDWKEHAADLESEMLARGMFFEVIDWSEDQANLPR
jgi:hypothetical protein